MDISNMCRSCMKDLPQNEIEMFDQSLMNMFLYCINKQEKEENLLPKYFCLDCNYKINSSYKFIIRAQDVNETLNNLILHNTEIKNEFYIDANDYSGNDTKTEIKNEFHFDSNDYSDNDDNTETDINYLDNPHSPLINEDSKLMNNSELLNIHEKTKKEYFSKSKKQKRVRKRYPIYTEIRREEQLKNEIVLIVEDLKPKRADNKDVSKKVDVKIKGSEKLTHKKTIEETTNTSQGFFCTVCKKPYTLLKALKIHYKLHHMGKGQITMDDQEIKSLKVKDKDFPKNRDLKHCPMCNKSYKLQAHFNNHIEKEHSSTKQYLCPFCPTVCLTNHALRYHKNKEHIQDKRFACNACDKRFRRCKGLAAHALTHSEERPFICDTCHMSFKMKQVLIKHLVTHENDRPFLCHICAKGFKAPGSLKEHMISHAGTNTFSCELCSFTSKHRTGLGRHMKREHYKNRPHACPHCRRAFYEKCGLDRHMRIHTGEKPYKCYACPLTFIDHWKCKMHIMRVHQVPFGEIPSLTANGQTKL